MRRLLAVLGGLILACSPTTEPTTTATSMTAAPATTSTSAVQPLDLQVSFPAVFYPETSPAYLEGTTSLPAEISVNGDLIGTTTPDIVSFAAEVPIDEGSTSLEISAIAENGAVATKVVEVIFDQGLTRQFAYLDDLDAEARTITVDFAEMFTGEEAIAAGAEDGVEVDTDFYIRNLDPSLETLPLASDVEPILILCLRDGPCITNRAVSLERWNDLRANSVEWYGQGQLPYWLTIVDGTVVQVAQQYLP